MLAHRKAQQSLRVADTRGWTTMVRSPSKCRTGLSVQRRIMKVRSAYCLRVEWAGLQGGPRKAASYDWEDAYDIYSPLLFNWKFYAAKYELGDTGGCATCVTEATVESVQPSSVVYSRMVHRYELIGRLTSRLEISIQTADRLSPCSPPTNIWRTTHHLSKTSRAGDVL